MKKFCAVLFIIIGILAIVLSYVSYDSYIGAYESSESYGGDAYTGIQNAAAQTANNVKALSEIVAFSTGSILLISGLFMIVFGLLNFAGPKQPKQQTPVYAAPQQAPVYRPAPQQQAYRPVPQPAPQPAKPATPPVNPPANP